MKRSIVNRVQIPLWHQKASQRADGITLWDYHVICVQVGNYNIIGIIFLPLCLYYLCKLLHLKRMLLQKKEGDTSHLVWDLDSRLQFPSPLAMYVSEAVRPSIQLFSEFQR